MVELDLGLELEKPLNRWTSPIPKRCDICGEDLIGTFVDGRIRATGSWGIMCHVCSINFGVGLGTGRGQLYNVMGEKLKG